MIKVKMHNAELASVNDIAATIGKACVVGEVARTSKNQPLSLKREDVNGASLDLTAVVSAFETHAQDALTGDDPMEVWNAAFTFAKAHGLTSYEMAQVLADLRGRGLVTGAVLTGWLKEGGEALGEGKDPALPDALVNRELAAHGARTTWKYAAMSKELHEWASILNTAFFDGKLPPPAISIERTRSNNLGRYTPWRDGLGLNFRINLNALHVHEGRAQRIAVLLHEMLHEAEAVLQGRTRGGNYHSRWFCDTARDFGIPTNPQGHHCGITPDGRLARLLASYGVPPDEPKKAEPADTRPIMPRAPGSGSQLARWACRCTSVWATERTLIEASCTRCRESFVRGARRTI